MSEISALSASVSQEMANAAAAVRAVKLAQQQDQQILDMITQLMQPIAQIQEAGKGENIDISA